MKVSLKSINITPPIGMLMSGFSERDHGAEGIHDELYAKIMVFDDGNSKAAIVACDLIGVDAVLTDKVRKIVSKKTDIKNDCILINAIHTHSSVHAARINGLNFLGTKQFDVESDNAYYQQLIQKIANGIVWANSTLEESTISFIKGEVDGLATNRNNPQYYYDKNVNIIKVTSLTGEVIGIIANHACHPTILDHTNYLYTADFVNYFREEIIKLYPGVFTAYIQGTAGSVSTRYTKAYPSYKEAERLGKLLADTVYKYLDNAQPIDVKLYCKSEELELKVKEFKSDEECIKDIENYKKELETLKFNGASKNEIRKAYVTLQGAERNLNMKKNVTVDSIKMEMQIVDFGGFSFIGIPGDVFGEIGRDISLLNSNKNIIALGYTNNFVGYIVSKDGFELDCYEKNMTIFDYTSHDRILEVAKKLINI